MSFQPTMEKVEWLLCSGWKRKVITLGARGGNSWVQIKWCQDLCWKERAKKAIKWECGQRVVQCASAPFTFHYHPPTTQKRHKAPKCFLVCLYCCVFKYTREFGKWKGRKGHSQCCCNWVLCCPWPLSVTTMTDLFHTDTQTHSVVQPLTYAVIW